MRPLNVPESHFLAPVTNGSLFRLYYLGCRVVRRLLNQIGPIPSEQAQDREVTRLRKV